VLDFGYIEPMPFVHFNFMKKSTKTKKKMKKRKAQRIERREKFLWIRVFGINSCEYSCFGVKRVCAYLVKVLVFLDLLAFGLAFRSTRPQNNLLITCFGLVNLKLPKML